MKIILLALLFLSGSAAYGQDIPKFQTSVSISVSADHLDGQIKSYINRELRSLSDVTVKDEDADFHISIIALERRTVKGESLGLAMSFSISRRLRFDRLLDWLDLPPAKEQGVRDYLQSTWAFHHHYLRTGASESLQEMCKEFIAEFDAHYIEEYRKNWREHYEGLKKKRVEDKIN